MSFEGVTFNRIPDPTPAQATPAPEPNPVPVGVEDATTLQTLRWLGVPIPDSVRKPLVPLDAQGFPVEGVEPLTFDEPAPELFSPPEPPAKPDPTPTPPKTPPAAPPVTPSPTGTPTAPAAPPVTPSPTGTPAAPVETPPAPAGDGKPPEKADPKAPGVMAQLGKAVEKLEGTLNKVLSNPTTSSPPAAADPPVDPELALRLEALEHLEKSGKYKGQPLRNQYQTFVKKYDDYRSTWEKANPGKPFDEDDEDHESFFNTHRPAVADEDIIRAEAVVETRREMQVEIDRTRVEQARSRAVEAGRSAAAAATGEMLQSFEVKTVDELKAKDPALAFAVAEMTPAVAGLVRVSHQLFTPGANPQIDESNKDHAFLLSAMQKYDALLAKAPPEESALPDGRRFVPLSQWNTLSPAQRENAWTLGLEPDVMAQIARKEIEVHVRARANQIRQWFPTPTPSPPVPTPPPPVPTPPPPVPAAPAPSPRIPSPPEGGAGAGAAPAGTAPASKSSYTEYF